MNKKLIAAAIAAVVAAPAAVAADTTLYGKAHVDIRSTDGVSPGTSSGNNYSVNSNASRLGVKGSEDLGDGLKAIFGYEMGYNMTDTNNGASPISARNAYVGLSGGFGTFLVGRHDTPAKVAFYAAGNDLVGDSIIDANTIAKGTNGKTTFTEVRADNAIAYITPNFSGFTVAAAIVPGEMNGTNNTSQAANDLADAYSLGAMYAGGGLKASVGYEVFTSNLNTALATQLTGQPAVRTEQKMWQLGASYAFGDFQVGAAYENMSNRGGVNGVDSTSWGLFGKAAFGNNYVAVNYANFDCDGDCSTTGLGETAANTMDADGYGIALGHKFSKRTQVYAAYHNTNTDGNASNPNQDTSSFALGMIHTF